MVKGIITRILSQRVSFCVACASVSSPELRHVGNGLIILLYFGNLKLLVVPRNITRVHYTHCDCFRNRLSVITLVTEAAEPVVGVQY